MKFKKALVMLPALLLVVGLGACDEITGSSNPSSSNDYGESTGTSDYEQPTDPGDDVAYTLRITITYNGTYQTLPSYAELYYAGDTNEWGFTKLTPNGSSYDLYFDTIPEAGEHEYGVLLDYIDSSTNLSSWNYKVNQGSGNETFTVLGSEEYGYVNAVTIEAKAELGSIIPDPNAGNAVNVTFAFTVTSTVVPTGNTVYFTGGFNNDNWQTWLECTNTSGTTWEYTFETLTPGAQIGYKVVYGTNPINGDWTWDTEITYTDQHVDISISDSNTTLSFTI